MKGIIDYIIEQPTLLVLLVAVAPCVVCEAVLAVFETVKRRREQKERYKPLKK